MKILPLGAEFFHAQRGQTDTKLIVTFHNFANSPKEEVVVAHFTAISNIFKYSGASRLVNWYSE